MSTSCKQCFTNALEVMFIMRCALLYFALDFSDRLIDRLIGFT